MDSFISNDIASLYFVWIDKRNKDTEFYEGKLYREVARNENKLYTSIDLITCEF